MRRRIAIAAIVAVLPWLVPGVAASQAPSSGTSQAAQQATTQRTGDKWKAGAAKTEDGGLAYTHRESRAAARSPGRRGGVWSRCTYARLPDTPEAVGLLDAYLGRPDGEGAWYQVRCPVEGSATAVEIRDTRWVPRRVVTTEVVIQEARERLVLPKPMIVLNPAAEHLQVVHIKTWLHTDEWQPWSETAVIDGLEATVTATPTSVTWTTGDGATVECAGPGALYDFSRPAAAQDTDCGHVYRVTSARQPNQAYTLTATTTYALTWTAAGAVGASGSLGTVDRAASVPVRVAEVQALEVAPTLLRP